jgi:pteridine reductase
MRLQNKVALVTGGRARIGRAIALSLAERGARVALTTRSRYAEAKAVAEEIKAAGGQALAIPADLAEPHAVNPVVTLTIERFGSLDILVNNAAVFPETPLADVTAKVWDGIFAVNLRAPFLLAKEAAPHMRAAGEGVIVNVTDIYAERTLPDRTPYVVSKAALGALTRALARELAPEIRVNAVAPGAILWPEDMPEDEQKKLEGRIPLGRKGQPDDVAKAVLFCIEGGDFMTGETIAVDGGRLLR